MGGIKSKFLFVLIVYFAGFATAIYTLAPAPEAKGQSPENKTVAHSALKSDEFAKSFNEGMHKFLGIAKDASLRTSDYVKSKMNESRLQQSSKNRQL